MASIEETLAYGRRRFGRSRSGLRPLFQARACGGEQAGFCKVCLAMSTQDRLDAAEAAGDPGPWRQQALLVAGLGWLMLCAISSAIIVIGAFGG